MIDSKPSDRAIDSSNRLIEIGQIQAAYGVKGWVKVFSFTRPIEQIFEYHTWQLENSSTWLQVEIEDSNQRSNSGLIAKFKGLNNREQAQNLAGKRIAVYQSDLKQLDKGEYYWSQLIGFEVFNNSDIYLGNVIEILETGANDVLVVKDSDSERLIPYADSIVLNVDIKTQRLVVDWETDY